MADLIRTYVVPLRREWAKSPRYKRSPKAIRGLVEFMQRHMKSEDVRVTPQLNHAIWLHGIKNPPPRIKVDAKKDDKGVVIVQLHGKPFPKPAEEKKEEGVASKVMDKLKGMAGGKPKAAKSESKAAPKADVKPAAPATAAPAAKPVTPAAKPAQPASPAAPVPPRPAPSASAPAQKPAEEKKDPGLRLKK